mmetsp:Transcript_20826/g.63727  ORF Transcript_20826/g.63727 Transcript_20826/m.63727 type:complete len:213 (+) Transcript_20826:838-1476(+)
MSVLVRPTWGGGRLTSEKCRGVDSSDGVGEWGGELSGGEVDTPLPLSSTGARRRRISRRLGVLAIGAGGLSFRLLVPVGPAARGPSAGAWVSPLVHATLSSSSDPGFVRVVRATLFASSDPFPAVHVSLFSSSESLFAPFQPRNPNGRPLCCCGGCCCTPFSPPRLSTFTKTWVRDCRSESASCPSLSASGSSTVSLLGAATSSFPSTRSPP